jgi:hypothetical protein
VRTRPLAAGLLAASACGAWLAANVIALLGVMVGLARGALGLLVAVVAVVLTGSQVRADDELPCTNTTARPSPSLCRNAIC